MQNLANALLNRYIGFSQLDDLDEAIWLFEHALTLTPRNHYRYLETLLGLTTSLNARFELLRLPDDRRRLAECAADRSNIDDDAVLAPVISALSRACAEQQAPVGDLYSSMEPPDAVVNPLQRNTYQAYRQRPMLAKWRHRWLSTDSEKIDLGRGSL